MLVFEDADVELVAAKVALGAGFAPLARPELIVLSLLVLALLQWRLHQQHAPLRWRLALLAPVVVLVGLWILYCLLLTGHPLPNTFYAKFASGRHRLNANLDGIFVQLFPSYAWFAYGASCLSWGLGAVLLFRKGWLAGLTVVITGTGFITGATVQFEFRTRLTGTITAHGRGEKVIVFKFKRKKQYKRTIVHRQNYTRVQVNEILA